MESSEAWRQTGRLDTEQGKGDPFAAAVRATRMAMIITDPRQADNPIVFVNDAFLRMTGYARDEVMGRNCRFLQGPDTDHGAVTLIREAVTANRDIAIDILNYRKDGNHVLERAVSQPGDQRGRGGAVLLRLAARRDRPRSTPSRGPAARRTTSRPRSPGAPTT